MASKSAPSVCQTLWISGLNSSEPFVDAETAAAFFRHHPPHVAAEGESRKNSRRKGKKPLSASILVQKYLRPAAVKAGILTKGQKVRFGFHNFRHSLASALVKMNVDPKTVQEFLRQAHVTTTLQLYAQSDMEAKRDAQGKFLEHQLTIRDYLRHSSLHVTDKYLQATAETKRLAQDKLVDGILPAGLLSGSKSKLIQ